MTDIFTKYKFISAYKYIFLCPNIITLALEFVLYKHNILESISSYEIKVLIQCKDTNKDTCKDTWEVFRDGCIFSLIAMIEQRSI